MFTHIQGMGMNPMMAAGMGGAGTGYAGPMGGAMRMPGMAGPMGGPAAMMNGMGMGAMGMGRGGMGGPGMMTSSIRANLCGIPQTLSSCPTNTLDT